MEIIPLNSGCSSHLIPESRNHRSHVKQVAKITCWVALAIVLGALTCFGLFALGCPLVAAIPLGGCVAGVGLIVLLIFSLKKLKSQHPKPDAIISCGNSDLEKGRFLCPSIPLASIHESEESGKRSDLDHSFNPYCYCGSAMSWRERCCEIQSRQSTSSNSSSEVFISCEETFATCSEAIASAYSCSSECSFATASDTFTTADGLPMCDYVDSLLSSQLLSLDWDDEFIRSDVGLYCSLEQLQSQCFGVSRSCSRLTTICEESAELLEDCLDGGASESSPMAKRCSAGLQDYYCLCPVTASSIASSRVGSRASSRLSRRSTRR